MYVIRFFLFWEGFSISIDPLSPRKYATTTIENAIIILTIARCFVIFVNVIV